MTVNSRQLVAAAMKEIETLSIDEAIEARSRGALLVDLRDIREIEREGKIPESYHAPRGMLEFWIDPDSRYHRPKLSSAEQLVLYCDLGWRSALGAKALQDMGLMNVSHIGGGFAAWKSDGAAVESGAE